MNKIWDTLTTGNKKREPENRKVKTSGQLFDWCNEQLKPMGLYVDNVTPYSLAVWKGENVIGYYNSLTEIKAAIKGGYVHEPYNL